jgi:hypothetical protein
LDGSYWGVGGARASYKLDGGYSEDLARTVISVSRPAMVRKTRPIISLLYARHGHASRLSGQPPGGVVRQRGQRAVDVVRAEALEELRRQGLVAFGVHGETIPRFLPPADCKDRV